MGGWGERQGNKWAYVNGAARLNVVRLESLVIGELLATVNEPDLVNLDALFLLKLLLDVGNRVRLLKVESLLTAREGLDRDLHFERARSKAVEVAWGVRRAAGAGRLDGHRAGLLGSAAAVGPGRGGAAEEREPLPTAHANRRVSDLAQPAGRGKLVWEQRWARTGLLSSKLDVLDRAGPVRVGLRRS